LRLDGMDASRLPRQPNILVVDDKRANFLALEGVLGQEFRMLFAPSGKEAIALLEKTPAIDVILMDVQMPGMDGFETATAIKRVTAWRDIPIIFITAVFSEDPFVKRGYQAGGIDYFSKPFDPDILRMKVRIYSSFRLQSDLLRQRERHVQESEELLRVGRRLSSVLESLPVGVLIADVEGRICQVTDEVAKILGTTPDTADAYGQTLGWWGSDGRVVKEKGGPLARALEGEKSHSERLRVQRLDRVAQSILISAAPLRGLDARIVGAVVLVQDLSEAEKIEEALEERIMRLISVGVELEESARR
jgi:PAS domain S-box-containing protein